MTALQHYYTAAVARLQLLGVRVVVCSEKPLLLYLNPYVTVSQSWLHKLVKPQGRITRFLPGSLFLGMDDGASCRSLPTGQLSPVRPSARPCFVVGHKGNAPPLIKCKCD